MWKRKNIAKALVVIGGFLCYMMADGCTFSVGILYSEFLDVFDQSNAQTAILPALIYALPQLFGPIICRFVDFAGTYYSAIFGGIFLAFSMFVSRFASNLHIMYVTMGFIGSIGLELTYVSGIVAVTKTFSNDKYLGLVLGITVSGSGIGVFTFNPLLNYLIDVFTWKGAFTILSAIFLHVILVGFIFKLAATFVRYTDKEKAKSISKENIIQIISSQENNHSSISIIPNSYSISSLNNIDENPKSELITDEHYDVVVHSKPIILKSDQRSSAFLSMTQTKHCEPFYKPINCQLKSGSLDRRINTGDIFPVSLPVDERSASFVRRLSLYSNQNIKGSHRESQESLSSKPSLLCENSENDILDVNKSKENDYNSITKSDTVSQIISHSKLDSFKVNLTKSFLSFFSLDIFKNKCLCLFYLISFFSACSIVVVWTFSYNHSIKLEIEPTKASMLVSIVGVGSCLGQITFGFFSAYLPAILLYAIGCIMAGIITIVLQWITVYWTLSICHLVFGFGQGAFYALFSVILLHYTSVELYPTSLGIFLFFSGCGNFIGTFMSGYIYDLTKEYAMVYSLGGSILVICAIMAVPLIYFWHSGKSNTTALFSS